MISRPSASTRSAVRCGRAVCPPGERADLDDVAGRGDRADPGAEVADLQPRVAVQREDPLDAVEGPVGDMSIAPPGCTSSAGWKISRTRPAATARWPARGRPRAPSRCGRRARRRASRSAPSRRTAGRWPRAAESVDVGTHGDAALAAPTSQTRPVPPGRVRGSRPAAAEVPDQRGGAVLGAAQLRLGVQRTAPGDDLRPVQRDHESSHAGPLPAPMSTTAGPRTARRTRPAPGPSPDPTAPRLFVAHRPILLTRTAVYQADMTVVAKRSPRGGRSAADGRTAPDQRSASDDERDLPPFVADRRASRRRSVDYPTGRPSTHRDGAAHLR